ncbi:hypothetical protein NliqN6_2056 [Naganishia liquefaciens]|uniref:C2H2-type domain-containing protein n=1 Tax=Naganishia liquefaciens TaxID=104408 RepID=A0A8H3TSX4_9TREE|nr:hypothetical protein NliqN6_2056 [Naganishia liquefaciens]
MGRNTPSKEEVMEGRPHTPVSALSQAFPPDIHDLAATLPLDLSGAGTPVGTTLTPSRPVFDPHSPFVAKRMETPSHMFPPASVDHRLRARLFGQGMDGGFLVSPMTEGIHSTVRRHMTHSSLSHTMPMEPRIYDDCQDDPFGEETMQSLGWTRQPVSTPATEDTPMFEAGVGLGVTLTNGNGSRVQSPVKISTPSKYPSALGAGPAPSLRRRPMLAEITIDATPFGSGTAGSSADRETQLSATAVRTSVQVPHDIALPSPTQHVIYHQSYVPGSQIANVKAPLNLSQVPRRARANRSVMSRSLSMNNAFDGPTASALTHEPLNRLPSRNISDSSFASFSTTACNNAEASPHLFPVGSGKTIYTGRRSQHLDSRMEPPPPHSAPSTSLPLEQQQQQQQQQQQRSVSSYSQSSRNALDTPALECSLESPAISTFAQSPWLTTPGLSHDGATFAQGTYYFSQEPHPVPTGLAIQLPPASQAPVGSMVRQDIHFAGCVSQGSAIQPPGIRVITPVYGEISHYGHYSSYPPPTMFAPSPNMPYMPYQLHPPAYLAVNAATITDPRNVQHVAPTGVLQDNISARHVSTPFASCSSGDDMGKGSNATPMARSISHGYTPVIQHHSQEYLYSTNLAATTDVNPYSFSLQDSAAVTALTNRTHPQCPSVPLTSIGEEVESSQPGSFKVQRMRYPAIGKRLRPGPRPKQKKNNASSSAQTSPEIQAALSNETLQEVAAPPEPKVEEKVPDQTIRSPTSPLKEVSAAAPKRHHPYVGTSTLTKEFLESCYTCFMMIEDGAGPLPCKRYRCNIDNCGRIFPRKSAIQSHVQTHLEDKPYVCTEPDCNAAFVRQHDLRRHIRIHSGTKPFQCPCGKGFARGDALMRHRQRGICSGRLLTQQEAL